MIDGSTDNVIGFTVDTWRPCWIRQHIYHVKDIDRDVSRPVAQRREGSRFSDGVWRWTLDGFALQFGNCCICADASYDLYEGNFGKKCGRITKKAGWLKELVDAQTFEIEFPGKKERVDGLGENFF